MHNDQIPIFLSFQLDTRIDFQWIVAMFNCYVETDDVKSALRLELPPISCQECRGLEEAAYLKRHDILVAICQFAYVWISWLLFKKFMHSGAIYNAGCYWENLRLIFFFFLSKLLGIRLCLEQAAAVVKTFTHITSESNL